MRVPGNETALAVSPIVAILLIGSKLFSFWTDFF